MQLHTSLAKLFAKQRSRMVRYEFINGLPGFLTVEPDGVLQSTALAIEDDKIVSVYVVRNPDKLRHFGEPSIQ
jgi:RNA polymerase sigma-70 factor (ECF subfamily)